MRFLGISVGGYRENTPEPVQGIPGVAEDGVPMDAADIEYEMERASGWAAVGSSAAGYYG